MFVLVRIPKQPRLDYVDSIIISLLDEIKKYREMLKWLKPSGKGCEGWWESADPNGSYHQQFEWSELFWSFPSFETSGDTLVARQRPTSAPRNKDSPDCDSGQVRSGPWRASLRGTSRRTSWRGPRPRRCSDPGGTLWKIIFSTLSSL